MPQSILKLATGVLTTTHNNMKLNCDPWSCGMPCRNMAVYSLINDESGPVVCLMWHSKARDHTCSCDVIKMSLHFVPIRMPYPIVFQNATHCASNRVCGGIAQAKHGAQESNKHEGKSFDLSSGWGHVISGTQLNFFAINYVHTHIHRMLWWVSIFTSSLFAMEIAYAKSICNSIHTMAIILCIAYVSHNRHTSFTSV